jgi:hypothetical protein
LPCGQPVTRQQVAWFEAEQGKGQQLAGREAEIEAIGNIGYDRWLFP